MLYSSPAYIVDLPDIGDKSPTDHSHTANGFVGRTCIRSQFQPQRRQPSQLSLNIVTHSLDTDRATRSSGDKELDLDGRLDVNFSKPWLVFLRRYSRSRKSNVKRCTAPKISSRASFWRFRNISGTVDALLDIDSGDWIEEGRSYLVNLAMDFPCMPSLNWIAAIF